MATQTAACHNPVARASGKRALPLAAKVARELGLVPTWPNLQTIRLAIESEARLFCVANSVIAELLISAGKERSSGPEYRPPSEWEKRHLFRVNVIDRFWFEDARWRAKEVFAEFEARHRRSEPLAC